MVFLHTERSPHCFSRRCLLLKHVPAVATHRNCEPEPVVALRGCGHGNVQRGSCSTLSHPGWRMSSRSHRG